MLIRDLGRTYTIGRNRVRVFFSFNLNLTGMRKTVKKTPPGLVLAFVQFEHECRPQQKMQAVRVRMTNVPN